MYIRIFRHVYLHVGLLLLAALSFFSPEGAQLWLALFFAAVHEGCHYMTARVLRVPVLSVALLPYGCHLRLGKSSLSAEMKVVLAGPLGSLLLFFLFRDTAIGRINGTLFCINLLPALPLDGGRLFRLFLWRIFGTFRGNRILRRTALFISAGLFYFAFRLPSPFLAAIATLLLMQRRLIPLSSPILQKKAAGSHKKRTFIVSKEDSLLSLSHAFSPFYHARFRVRGSGKMLTETAVSEALRHSASATVSDLLY